MFTVISVSLFLIICSLLLAIFYFRSIRNFDYWKNKGIASDEPSFLFGSLKDVALMRRYIGDVLEDIYKKYPNEKVVGMFRGQLPTILIRDLDIAKNILIKDFSTFQNRGRGRNLDADILSRNIIHLEEEEWRVIRKKLTPTFTSSKIKNMFPLIEKCSDNFRKFLMHLEGEIETTDLMQRFSMEIIGACFFGIKTNTLEEKQSPFVKAVYQIFLPRPFKMLFQSTLPRLFYALRIKAYPKEVIDFFVSFIGNVIKERKNTPGERHDFIDLLLSLQKSDKAAKLTKEPGFPDTIIEFTDDIIVANSFAFFVAGFETSSSTMRFALHELAHNPQVQQKAFEDISSVLKTYNGIYSYDSLKEMRYIEMIVYETLRIHPPASLIMRKCNKKYYIDDCGIYLNVGDLVMIPNQAIHHDPRYYPEPDQFIPERFCKEELAKRHLCTFLPFGEGPRSCIGMRFAITMVMAGLVSVLRSFRVEPTKRTPRRLVFNPKSNLLSVSDGVWINLIGRSSSP